MTFIYLSSEPYFYSLFPIKLKRNMNMFKKFKYKLKAPIIPAFAAAASPYELLNCKYVCFMFCVSYAVKPANINTPIMDTAKCIAEL